MRHIKSVFTYRIVSLPIDLDGLPGCRALTLARPRGIRKIRSHNFGWQLFCRMRGKSNAPHPWNCTPPLSLRLGLKALPLIPGIGRWPPPAKLKARGRGFSGLTRRPEIRDFRAGYLSFPLSSAKPTYPCQTTKSYALPTALSGVRLTHPADPMRGYRQFALGSRGAAVQSSSAR